MVERFAENPLIVPGDVPPSRDDYEVICAFNPGAVKYNGQVLLLLRVAERPKDKGDKEEVAPILNPETGQISLLRVKHHEPGLKLANSRVFFYEGKKYLTSISHLRLARSTDGINFQIDPQPAVFPSLSYETYGIEDPRITQVEDTFYITYKAISPMGICTALLTTADFVTFKRQGIIFCPENLDVVLFPEKPNNRFYALTRPVPETIGPKGIWLASSPDTVHWGNHQPLILPRKGFFDSARTGGSCVPIKTPYGWLEIYHGADETDRYCLGAVLLELSDPSIVIARSKVHLMQPEANYEIQGFHGNVVFSCGAIEDDNGSITIYYGAADQFTAAAKTSVDKMLTLMSPVPFDGKL